jgi:hypothetical protein
MSLTLIIATTRLLWERFLVEHADMAAKVECFLEDLPWRNKS